jgi:FAD/FMN-containing dehydrogenase
MSELRRREFLRRAGGVVLAAAAVPAGYELIRASGADASDPRVRKLARALEGPVYGRGTSGYARDHRVFNRRFEKAAPLAVAEPESVADVEACVSWAKRYGIRLAPRSGGHSYAGYSTGNGVLQVDMRRMAGVHLDSGSKTATIGPGAPLMRVYTGLAARGVTIPAGSCPTVGVGGLALGGGHGLASRKLGLTTDNLTEVGLVLADGTHVTANATTNPDLFWACRGGGGGNFGIATSLRFRVHRVSQATRFFVSWPWRQADSVFAAWQEWAPDAPDEVNSVLNLSSDRTIHCAGEYLGGSRSKLRDLLRPVTRVGSPSVSMHTESYLDVQRWLAGCGGKSVSGCLAYTPQFFSAKSHYLRHAVPSGGRAAILRRIEHARALPGGAALLLDAYGGAINRVAPDATAFVHRGERVSAQLFASWGSAGAGGAMLGWLRDLHSAMKPYASGFAYQNYIDADLEEWQHAYYGSNFDELVAVKARYDPGELFHFRQSIPPS